MMIDDDADAAAAAADDDDDAAADDDDDDDTGWSWETRFNILVLIAISQSCFACVCVGGLKIQKQIHYYYGWHKNMPAIKPLRQCWLCSMKIWACPDNYTLIGTLWDHHGTRSKTPSKDDKTITLTWKCGNSFHSLHTLSCVIFGGGKHGHVLIRGVIPSDRKIGQDSFPHSKSGFHTSGIDCGEHLVPLSSSLNVAQSINRTNLAQCTVFYIRSGAGFLPSTVYDMEIAPCLVTYCNYGPKEIFNKGMQA